MLQIGNEERMRCARVLSVQLRETTVMKIEFSLKKNMKFCGLTSIFSLCIVHFLVFLGPGKFGQNKVLYPYTAERRDVLGNTSPEAREISQGRGFCTPRPSRFPEGEISKKREKFKIRIS